jgi:hypothetical protein
MNLVLKLIVMKLQSEVVGRLENLDRKVHMEVSLLRHTWAVYRMVRRFHPVFDAMEQRLGQAGWRAYWANFFGGIDLRPRP